MRSGIRGLKKRTQPADPRGEKESARLLSQCGPIAFTLALLLAPLLAFLLALLLALPSSASSQSNGDTRQESAANADTATNMDAPLFMWGGHQLGLTLGYGHGVSFAGSGAIEGHRVRELILLPHYQIALTRPPLSRAWYRGQLSFRAEATLIVNFEPHTGVAGGLGLLLRYHFLSLGPWRPYIEGGAGFLGLDLDLADQVDGFAFQPQGGVGLLYAMSPRTSVELGTRFHHISNAFTRSPNGGIDSMQVLFGVTHHFD